MTRATTVDLVLTAVSAHACMPRTHLIAARPVPIIWRIGAVYAPTTRPEATMTGTGVV